METFPPVFINREELVSKNVKLETEIGQLRKKKSVWRLINEKRIMHAWFMISAADIFKEFFYPRKISDLLFSKTKTGKQEVIPTLLFPYR